MFPEVLTTEWIVGERLETSSAEDMMESGRVHQENGGGVPKMDGLYCNGQSH